MDETYYEILFDMKSSHSFTVKAKGTKEAKQKAFKKFEKIRNKLSEYTIDIEDLGH